MNPATLIDWIAAILVMALLTGVALMMLGAGIWVFKQALLLGSKKDKE